MRRYVQIAGWTMIWGSLLIFGYLGYQLFVTDLLNRGVQAQASVDLDQNLEAARTELPPVEEVEDTGTTESVVFHPEDQPVENSGFARIRIPKISLDSVVFEGVGRETLSMGPGHMPGTALPGQPGNAVISGHRTTHGRPFYELDRLAAGDRIEVETAIGVHVYEVRESFVVLPTDVWVTEDKPGAWLTLTTCNPRFSARERLIVTAELVEGPNLAYATVLKERAADLA
jgi:sortase A